MLDRTARDPEGESLARLSGAVALARLSELPAGKEATIVEVMPGPPQGRCLELGLIPGAHVRVIQAGDPTLLGVDGGRLAIARGCLAHILVSPVPTSSPSSS